MRKLLGLAEMGKLEQSRLLTGVAAFRLWQLGIALILLTSAFSVADERVCVLSVAVDYDRCLDESDPITACTNVLENNPKNLNARASLCEAFVRITEFDSAQEILTNGDAVHHGDRFTLDVLARMKSNVVEARSRLSSPRDASDSTTLKYLLLRCGQVNDLGACNDALTISPDSFEALSGKGNILLEEGDAVGAIQAYRKSLELRPGQEAIAANLRRAEADRQRQVKDCLRSSDGELCRRLLIAGEKDSHDILSHMGDLELANSRFRQARDSYKAADAIQSTSSSRTNLKIMNSAVRCLEREESGACLQALDATPTSGKYQRLRDELSDILASERVAPASPISPQPSPTQQDTAEAENFVAGCRELAGRSGQPDDAIEYCSNATRQVLTDDQAYQIEEILTDLKSRRVLFTNIEKCEDAADARQLVMLDYCTSLADETSDTRGHDRLTRAVRTLEFESKLESCREGDDGPDNMSTCREATNLAATNTQRQQIENIVHQKDARLSQQRRIANLKQQCVGFDPIRLARALSNCNAAIDLSPDDVEIRAAAARVVELVNQYDNEPIRVSAGMEAITF